jgi:hypothetical protein
MRNKAEFKTLLEALESLRLFFICYLLSAHYASDCPGFVNNIELLNKVLLLVKM